MYLITDDFITLHTNINRQVGKEIFPGGSRAYNDNFLLESIQRLIKNDKLAIKQEIETSLNYFTVPQLKEILKKNKLRMSGNKPDLIQRIKKNFDSIQNIELPSYYEATDEGLSLIEDTKFLMHFWDSWDHISYKQAFYIAENYIDNNCEDKVLAIYDYKLSKMDGNSNPIWIYRALCDYYLNKKKDLNNSRKYLNLIYYDNLKMMTNDLYLHSRDKHDYIYYDTDGVLKYNSIKETVENNINSIFVNTYEILIADFKYSVDKLVNLFKEDINDYEDDLSIELIYYFINCVMAFTFEENENEAIMELYEWLKNKYPYKPTDEDKDDEFDYEDYDDNYGDDFIPIDIQELKKVKEDINIYIDKNDGQVILFLKEKRLNTFLNENNQEY